VSHLRVLGAASYGSGGVIDVTEPHAGPKGTPLSVTYVVAVGPGRKWAIANGYENKPTVGTKATATTGFDASVNATVAALRSKNCPAFIKNSLTNTNNPSECTQPFASSSAKALSADPKATLTKLGGNQYFQFYSITLKGYPGHPSPTYLTFPVTTTTPGPGVTSPTRQSRRDTRANPPPLTTRTGHQRDPEVHLIRVPASG
jgi:hypothetical protein